MFLNVTCEEATLSWVIFVSQLVCLLGKYAASPFIGQLLLLGAKSWKMGRNSGWHVQTTSLYSNENLPPSPPCSCELFHISIFLVAYTQLCWSISPLVCWCVTQWYNLPACMWLMYFFVRRKSIIVSIFWEVGRNQWFLFFSLRRCEVSLRTSVARSKIYT